MAKKGKGMWFGFKQPFLLGGALRDIQKTAAKETTRSAELVMIISYQASPSRILVLLKTLRHIIENLKKKSERKERSFRENRKKEIIFRSNVINQKGAKTFRCIATILVKVE